MSKRVVLFVIAVNLLGTPQFRAAAGERAGGGSESQGSLERMDFGKTPEGTPVDLYVLTNGKMTAKVMTYGAILTELQVPDRNGKLGDVVLGFDNLASYLAGHPYFGATTGRVANRVAKGQFTLDGKEYKLAVNNGPNSLHGGLKAFDKVVWKAEDASGPGGAGRQADIHQPGRRRGVSGKPERERDLYGHSGQ